MDILRCVRRNGVMGSTTYTSPTLLASFEPVFANAWALFEKLQILPEDVRGIGLTLKELGSVGAEKTPQRAGKPKRGRDASPLTIQELLKRPHKAAKPMLDWNTVVEMCEMRVVVESEEAKEAKRLCEWMMSERGEEEEEWVRGYMESHDPNEELVVVMRELMKARLKCDVRGSEGVLAAMRSAKNEEWKGVLRELEEMVKNCYLWLWGCLLEYSKGE